MKRFFSRLLSFGLILLTLFSVCPSADAAGSESGPEAQAAAILSGLTLEQKLGQMLMPAFQTWTDARGSRYVTELPDGLADAIREFGFGGVALFSENAADAAAAARLVADLQAAALDSAAGVPLLIAADQEGGYITRLGTGTTLCGNMALGAAGDPEVARQAAELIGSELDALGINVDFAPVMDVNSNPANPIIGVRSFSDDPALAAALGSACIEGLHAAGVASALKHFPGHGDTAVDSHTGLPCIDKSLAELRECELIPFLAGIRAGTDLIMTAHIQFPQIETETCRSRLDGREITLPATLSHTIITDLLRGELGYTGVVSTDAMTMDAIVQHFGRLDAARLAINAGVDILLMPVTISSSEGVEDCRAYLSGIAAMVRDGRIDEGLIDAAVTRILLLKLRRGLTEQTFDREKMAERALSEVGSEAHHELEWKLTERAITLVKNDRMLPVRVPSGGRVCFFCSYSDEVPAMEYAIGRLRQEGRIPENADCTVICYQGRNASEFRALVSGADAVVASVETFRDGGLTLSGGWQAAFLDALIRLTHDCGGQIAVLSLHLPYDLARFPEADALLAAYCAKGMEEIPAAFDGHTKTYGPNLPVSVCAVFGSFIPSGTLPVDVPALDRNGYSASEILYPRGFGLTDFGRKPGRPHHALSRRPCVLSDAALPVGQSVGCAGIRQFLSVSGCGPDRFPALDLTLLASVLRR